VSGTADCWVGDDWLAPAGLDASPPVAVSLLPPHADATISTAAVAATAEPGDQRAAIQRTFSSRVSPTDEDDGGL